jgi:hypothetical protein
MMQNVYGDTVGKIAHKELKRLKDGKEKSALIALVWTEEILEFAISNQGKEEPCLKAGLLTAQLNPAKQ